MAGGASESQATVDRSESVPVATYDCRTPVAAVTVALGAASAAAAGIGAISAARAAAAGVAALAILGALGMGVLTWYALGIYRNERIVFYRDRVERFDHHGRLAIETPLEAIEGFKASRGEGMLAGDILAGTRRIPVLGLTRDLPDLIARVESLKHSGTGI